MEQGFRLIIDTSLGHVAFSFLTRHIEMRLPDHEELEPISWRLNALLTWAAMLGVSVPRLSADFVHWCRFLSAFGTREIAPIQ